MKRILRNDFFRNRSQIHVLDPSCIKFSSLENGLKVVSFENESLMSCIGMNFPNGGRVYEIEGVSRGFSNLFNSSVLKNSENFDESIFTNSAKYFIERESFLENQMLFLQSYRKYEEESVSLFLDGIFNAKFSEKVLKEQMNLRDSFIMERKTNPCNVMEETPWGGYLMDRVLESCFGKDSIVGRSSLIMSDEITRQNHSKSFDSFKTSFETYSKEIINPQNSVLAGTGIEHEKLVDYANTFFEHHSTSTTKSIMNFDFIHDFDEIEWHPDSLYEEYLDNPTQFGFHHLPPLTSFVACFPIGAESDIFECMLLNELIGGGNSFSQGGPGKGLNSIIYKHFLPKFPFFNMEASWDLFMDKGVMMFHASTFHDYNIYLPKAIFECIPSIPKITKEKDFEGAKKRLLAKLFGAMEVNRVSLYKVLEQLNREKDTENGEKIVTTESIRERILEIDMKKTLDKYQRAIEENEISTLCIGNLKGIPKRTKLLEEFKQHL